MMPLDSETLTEYKSCRTECNAISEEFWRLVIFPLKCGAEQNQTTQTTKLKVDDGVAVSG